MIKRKLKIDNPEDLLPLLEEIHSRAKKQPGYVSADTLRSLDDPEDIVIISKWETADDWQKWLQSKERRDIQGRVDSLIGEKTFYVIYENIKR
jgi:heme-degrading monooxygenase HmoA